MSRRVGRAGMRISGHRSSAPRTAFFPAWTPQSMQQATEKCFNLKVHQKRGKRMRRKLIAFAGLGVLLVAGIMLAASANFHEADASASGLNLVVSFKESGLDSAGFSSVNSEVHVANASANYQCFNGGGNHPQAGNKETVSGSISQSGTFLIRNGQTTGSITV